MPKNIVSGVLEDFLVEDIKDLVKKMPWMEKTDMQLCASVDQLKAFVDRVIAKGVGDEKPHCCLDMETTGLNTRMIKGKPAIDIVGIALALDANVGIYVPTGHKEGCEFNLPQDEVLEEIQRLCRCSVVIVHNAKYDLTVLKNYGITIANYDEFEDTLILARLYDAGQKEIGLKHLSKKLLEREMIELGEIAGKSKRLDMVSPKICYVYAASDSLCTYGLYSYFMAHPIVQDQRSIYNLEKKVVPVVMQMEANLIKIDREYLKAEKVRVEERLKVIEREIYQVCGGREFNIGSPSQLGKVLFEDLKYEYPNKEKTKSGQYMTDTATLGKIADKPAVKIIIEYRTLGKSLNTYIINLLNNCDENGFIKVGFNQNGTDTGRFSSPGGKGINADGYCGMNVQSIPSNYSDGAPDIRRAFIARKPGGKIVAIDFSGEELRVTANLSKEKKWIDEFLTGSADLHSTTGKAVFKKDEITKAERQIAKCVAKGTLIASGRGWIPIENLKKNDKVITHTGELKKIEKVWEMGTKPGIRVITRTGHRIICGVNHRFLTINDEWVRAEDLKPGLKIKTVSCEKMAPNKIQRAHFNIWDKGNNRFVSEDLPYVEISPLWARLIGYIMGDGSICTNSVGVICSEEYEDVKNDIVSVATKLGLNPRVRKSRRLKKDGVTYGQWLYRIDLGSRILVRFFREIGFSGRREWKEEEKFPGRHKSSKIFRVPRIIFESPKYVAKEFLSGLFETDGTVSPSQVSVTTKDRELAEDLIILLASFGIRAHIVGKESKRYSRMYYKVSLGGHASKVFEKEIGFISKAKKERLRALALRGVLRPRPGNFLMKWETEIKTITPIKNIDLMDLTVEGDHTYVAQGLVTHNTLNFQILYGSGPRGIAEQAKISEAEARKAVEGFLTGLPILAAWIKSERARARKAKAAKTPFGRIRPLHMFYDSGDRAAEGHADRCSVNFLVQGCLRSTEKVLTDRGYLPIYEVKSLKDKNKKIKVWTGTSWETFDVLNRGKYNLATIELHNGLSLNCDTRHEVLTVGRDGYKFKKYKDLNTDTQICVSVPTKLDFGVWPKYPKTYYKKTTHNRKALIFKSKKDYLDMAYILGYIIGDGSVNRVCLPEKHRWSYSVAFCFGKDKLKHYEFLKKTLKRMGLNLSPYKLNKGSLGESYTSVCNSISLIEFLKDFGYNFDNKGVPSRLFTCPIEMREAFIRGYFDTDGSKKVTNRYNFHTPNLALLKDVQLIGWTLGCASRISEDKGNAYSLNWESMEAIEDILRIPRTTKYKYRGKDMILPKFMHQKILNILEKAGPHTRAEKALLSKLRTRKNVSTQSIIQFLRSKNCSLPDMYYYYKLKKKESLGIKEETYTLAVHSDLHRFDSAGIISKNTCADIMKIAMVRVSNWILENNLQDEIKILLTMHDELVFEMPGDKLMEYIPILNNIMCLSDILQGTLKWPVPFSTDAEYGDSWHVDEDFFVDHPELKTIDAPIVFNRPTQVIEESVPESKLTEEKKAEMSLPESNQELTLDKEEKTPSENISKPVSEVDTKELTLDSVEANSAGMKKVIPFVNGTIETQARPDLDEEIIYKIRDRTKVNLVRLNQIIAFLTDECSNDRYSGPVRVLKIQDRDGSLLSISNIKVRADSFYALARFSGI